MAKKSRKRMKIENKIGLFHRQFVRRFNTFYSKTLPLIILVILSFLVMGTALTLCTHPLEGYKLMATILLLAVIVIMFMCINKWILYKFIHKEIIIASNWLMILAALSCIVKASIWLKYM